MKRIKTFAARGLLICGLASYATPALAATNACSHANKKEVGTHMDHWSQNMMTVVQSVGLWTVLVQCVLTVIPCFFYTINKLERIAIRGIKRKLL